MSSYRLRLIIGGGNGVSFEKWGFFCPCLLVRVFNFNSWLVRKLCDVDVHFCYRLSLDMSICFSVYLCISIDI